MRKLTLQSYLFSPRDGTNIKLLFILGKDSPLLLRSVLQYKHNNSEPDLKNKTLF